MPMPDYGLTARLLAQSLAQSRPRPYSMAGFTTQVGAPLILSLSHLSKIFYLGQLAISTFCHEKVKQYIAVSTIRMFIEPSAEH